MKLTLILGNQLFSDFYRTGPCLMIEDQGLAKHFQYHQLRVLHQFVAMRDFRDELIHQGISVDYFEYELSLATPFLTRLGLVMKQYAATTLSVAAIPDVFFRERLQAWAKSESFELEFLPSPQFLVSQPEFVSYLRTSEKPFLKTFYERQRLSRGILLNPDRSPAGGKWSFDNDNRKKIPKNIDVPPLLQFENSPHFDSVIALVQTHFSDHPGLLPVSEGLWLPTTRAQSLRFLDHFFDYKFNDFGPYEDAVDTRDDFLFHSALSPLMNLGLLSPQEIIDKAIAAAPKYRVPIESLEGFIRQILGWREFVHGIHQNFREEGASRNFFGHQRKLKPCWYDATTGLPPVDDAIRKVNRLGYNHHIERLMVLSNVMLLSEVHPGEVHRWFMEMYLDSYEWVMGPNVYGMAQFSDGGIFATKPYICGSNYILKMSHYPRGEWCDIWDGLYWSFIHRNAAFFAKNPRLSMMTELLSKIEPQKRVRLFTLADRFKDHCTLRT